MNPSAGSFVPTNGNQVSPVSSYELPYKGEGLQRELARVRTERTTLEEFSNTLLARIATLERSANVKDQKASSVSVPPHLRMKTATGFAKKVPPHHAGAANGSALFTPVTWSGTDDDGTSGKPSDSAQVGRPSANNPLVTDGNVDDTITERIHKTAVERELTPPLSPKRTELQMSTAVDHLSLTDDTSRPFKPQYIASLPELPHNILSKIPASPVSFSPDFLRNQLGGTVWSPGMVIIPPPQPSLLPDRMYYTVDPSHNPYLPSAPGEHGAKLVPFFNDNPEDVLDLPDGWDATMNLPLFILRDVPDAANGKPRKRYVYYGHYSQSRWSDKLDYDRMTQCVPTSVREYWASELSATGRPEWVTKALQKHFFPAPEYDGALPGLAEEEGGSVAEEEFAKREEKVAKDVGRFVEQLRSWKKEADMRTSLIRKDYIMAAFDKADADEVAALRLWWEYLECVDYREDFYTTLVQLQSRNASYA